MVEVHQSLFDSECLFKVIQGRPNEDRKR